MGYDCLFCKVSLWLLEGEWSVEEETRQEAAGTSLMVQWLRLGLQMQGVWVWSLVRKLRSHTSLVQFSRSVVSDSAIPWIAALQASLSITNSQSSLRLISIESVMASSHLILCHPFLLLPPTPPSIRVFSNESTLHMRLPKYWSFSFSISPAKEHPGLISFRMDWLNLLAVQGTHTPCCLPKNKT